MENPLEEREKQAAMAQELAVLDANNTGINKAVAILANKYDLTLTRQKLLPYRKHPKYLETRKEAEKGALELAQLTAQTGCAELVPKMIKTLTKMLDEKGTQAVQASTLICKIVGVIDKDDNTQQQATSLTVIMPGAKKEKEVGNITKRD